MRTSIGRFTLDIPEHLSVTTRQHRLPNGHSFASAHITVGNHALGIHEDTLLTSPDQLAELVASESRVAKPALRECRYGSLSGKTYKSSVRTSEFTWIDWWLQGSRSLFCANVQGHGALSCDERDTIEMILASVEEPQALSND